MKVMALSYSMGKVSKGNVFWDNKHKFIVSSSEAFSTLSGKRTSLQNLFHRGRLFSFWSRFGSVEKVHSTWIDDAVVSHQEKRHFYSFLDIFPAFVNFGYVWHNANHTIGAPAEKGANNTSRRLEKDLKWRKLRASVRSIYLFWSKWLRIYPKLRCMFPKTVQIETSKIPPIISHKRLYAEVNMVLHTWLLFLCKW